MVRYRYIVDGSNYELEMNRINSGDTLAKVRKQLPADSGFRFRLPSETEWEYAARGGAHWIDGFTFSGGSDIDDLAWYDQNSGKRTHPVGQKAPNQLGICDMSGSVWSGAKT